MRMVLKVRAKRIDFTQQLAILKELLKMARAGKCGRIYCDAGELRIGTDEYGNRRWVSWELAAGMVKNFLAEQEPGPTTLSILKRGTA